MSKPMFDAEALIAQFQNATAKQGEQLRAATGQALLSSLQGRELTLKNMRTALKQVADAASTGLAKNVTAGVDPEALLDKAVAGLDDAMLKAVEANRMALTTLNAQGADLREKHLAKAIDDLEKMQAGGTLSGAQAATTAEQMAEQMQAAVRTSRAASLKAAQALAESYTAMVSGVLLGMSDALQSGSTAKKTKK